MSEPRHPEPTPLARWMGVERRARPTAAAPAAMPEPEPLESAEQAHARGLREGLDMLDHALAQVRSEAAADRAAMQADVAVALEALGRAYAAELGQLAQAIAAHVLGAVPEAADRALLALAEALGTTAAGETEYRAHPAAAARLETLLGGTGFAVVADPALSEGMVAARMATAERVDSLAMRLDRIAAALAAAEEPA